MPKLPGISHLQAIKTLAKLRFRIVCEGKHTVLSNGDVRLTIPLTVPRHKSINAFTMGSIAADAGLTPDQFRHVMLGEAV